MAKQLNIDLNFNAHTEQAKTQIQDLKNSLNNLSSSAVGQPLPITGEIMKAQDQVLVLKKALNDAFNVNTGKFDLSKFNSSLKNSGTSLSQIRISLQSLGVEGQQSFMKLAQSIMSAEVPLGRTNRLLTSLGATLKNTIKWQLSSSMLHGFMSAISSAYGYAQDLNESLNNIRIVTGQSSDQMERFAIKANKAAKALSASTLDYTNAALIYYQQGLNDEEVMARSEVTVKMANVTGQTAEQVSDQMTAIWNNFYDGSKSLEYYSDAITALGAATASSSDEIAQGLEKFAAVADTVGLSYEYATSALATVVAETRQAPEVVGTAFKTILARIQGLKLGETLEDGTDLNKYSEALMAVGVNIKTTNGQLKDADTILQETAEKWSTLGEDTKVALAQTVGGMRQYNQFISIMENWDKIEKNKTLAETSEGTLTKQQKIYAESWEGARDRVKAAMEDIYKDLLKDEFFIDLLNGLEKLLTFVDNFVESIGGAKGVLTALGSILLNTFSGQAAKGLENMVYNFKSFVGLAGQETMTMKQQAYNEFQLMQQSVSGKTVGTSYETQGINAALEQQLFLENELFNKKKSLTDEERETASLLLEQNRLYGEQVILAGQKTDKAQQDQAAAKQPLLDAALMNMSSDRANEMFNSVDKKFTFAEKIKTELAELDQAWLSGEMDIDSYKEKLTNLGKEANKLDLSEVSSKIAEAKGRVSETKNGVRTGIDVQRTSSNIDAATETNVKKTLNKKLNPDKDADMSAGINKYVKTTKAATEEQKNFNTTLNNSKKVSKDIINNFNTVTNSTQSWSRSIVSAASGIMSLSMAIQSVKNLGNIWKNEDLSMGEKILQTTTALGMAIPMAINGLKGLKSTFGGLLTTLMAQVQLETAYIALLSDESTATLVTAASQAVANAENKQEVAIKQAEILVQQGVIKEDEKEATVKLLLNSTRKKGLATIIASTSARISSWAASKLENAENKKGIAVLIAKKIAQDAANASTLAACWVIGLIVAAILALVAAVALLVMAFQDAQRQSIDQKMKDNKVAIDELKESIAETKQEFEEFKSSIESLQESYKVIDGMTASMGNLSDKIMETNQQVIDLIEKYPQLMEYVTRDTETGLLKISQEGINSIMSDFISTQYAQQAALAWSEKRQAQWTQQEFGEKYQYTVETDEGEETTLDFGEYDDILEKHASTIMQGTDEEIENIIKNSAAEFSQTISEEGLTYADLRDDAKEYYRQQTIEDNAAIVQRANVASAIYEGTGNSLRAASNKNIKETDAEADAIDNSVQSKVDNFDDNWNDHKNYLSDKNNNEREWDTTKQQQEYILKAIENKFGKDARYVAQRSGNMVVSVDGQEQEYSQTQFKEWLYEALYKDELNNLIASKKLSVDDSLKKSKVSSDAVKAMSTEDKANLDNIKYSLEQNIGTVGAQVFESMVNEFTGDEDEVSKLLEFTDTFNNIDWSSGSAAMEQFRLEADRLGIVMSAENQGYLEDYANKMRDNAKLMEGAQNYVNNLNKSIEDQAAEVGLSTTALEEYSDQLKEQSEYQDLTDSQLAKAAINQKKARIALDELAESWDAVKTAVKENDVMSEDYEKGIAALKKAYKELFNMDVSDEFLTNAENIELMEKALEGSQEAFEELSKLAGQDWLSNLDFGETKLDTGAILNVDGFRTTIAEIESLINSADWTPEMGIDDSYINTLNEYVRAGKVTVDEINSYFGNVHGIEFEQDVKYMKPADAMAATTNTSNTTVTKNTIKRSPMVDSDGNEISKGGEYTEEIVSQVSSLGNAAVNENGEIAVPILKPKGDGGNSSGGGGGGSNISVKPQVDVTAGSTTRADTMSKGSGGGGGGGNSKPKKAEKKKKTDVVDRYKRVEDKIDDVSDAMKRAQSAADGLWGQSRINKLNQINNLLGNQLSLLREQKNQVLDNLKTDKNDLISVGKSMGYTVQFDDAGLITNSDAILTDLWKKYSQAVDSNNDGYTDEAEQEAADKIQDQIDEFKDAMEQYDETRELDADIQANIDDAIRERQANFLEILNHKFEVELTLIEVEQATNDYYTNKFSKTWYDAAEGAVKLNEQVDILSDGLDVNERKMQELVDSYNTIDPETGESKISQADFVSGLTELISDSYDKLAQLQETSETLIDNYSNMFDLFNEEVANMTDRVEHSNSVLEHFSTLMELTGQSMDYKKMGTILEGQAKMAEDQATIAKSQFEAYQAEADQYKALMENATTEETREFYKGLWVTAIQNAEEAQENFLNSTEAWAEAEKAIVENSMNEIAKILEETFTADFGGSFDQLNKQMERAEALQEEYLTNTNKIYETTKLINNIQVQIDKTSNTVAKRKLKAFQDETAQLANQNQLSQFELDIQQAKYDLLLAEIALEEAQNAKSTVRLRRDSEGNFGYVYSADEEQVSNAEQGVLDAENALYNIRLDGANNYTSKYIETLQAMYDELREVEAAYLNGEIATMEEYTMRVNAIQEYYGTQLTNISGLYNIALSEDSSIAEDAWSTNFGSITSKTGTWLSATSSYISKSETLFKDWEKKVDSITTNVGQDFNNVAGYVSKVTTESEKLKEKITKKGGLIDGFKQEAAAVKQSNTEHANKITKIQEEIQKYEELLALMGIYIQKESELNPPKKEQSNNNNDSNKSKNNDSNKSKNNDDKAEGVAAAIWIYGHASGWGNGSTRLDRLKEKGVTKAQTILNEKAWSGELYEKYYGKDLSKYYYGAFDTGGYTGAWGPDGKLAILHEKELVLNKEDTKNLLDAISLIRNQGNNWINQAVQNQQLKLTQELMNTNKILSKEIEKANNIMQQDVKIEANFPNVNSKKEIEDAFMNLANEATQYISKYL